MNVYRYIHYLDSFRLEKNATDKSVRRAFFFSSKSFLMASNSFFCAIVLISEPLFCKAHTTIMMNIVQDNCR